MAPHPPSNVHHVPRAMSSSVSSRSHRKWYDDSESANLIITQYNRKALEDPPPRVRLTPEQLQSYVDDYVHYMQLAGEQNKPMAKDRAKIRPAYARARETLALEEKNSKPIGLCTYADIQAALEELARKCKKTPRSFEDRILLATYAANYVILMKDHVLRHPTRYEADARKVIRMAKQELARALRSSHNWQGASFNDTPEPIELIPANLRGNAQPVTDNDLRAWWANLPSLVGVGFINKSPDSPYETKNGVFFVRDYVTTARKSEHFDVQFESSGEDVFSFSPAELFELITTATHVRVENAP
ncbi:hypothetical protein FPV67DRAFT_1491277 [Lyophyllum atratum]|nr:hypothetical protein FPV67DRAFT_1491277 [Lyophyllum atratum]